MSDVKVSVTFRHTEPTDALKQYAEEKMHRLGKYFSQSLDAHVVLSVESKERHTAEVELHALGVIHAKEQTEDLYSAIDLVTDNLKRQLRKQKDKIKLEPRRKPPE
ncbi:MAG TPA: ribosome-associated translation inhibitor RaiA [Candidatus Binatia bacterium]|jgi:ribosome hibernation promoting factor|nr:ribosome-associated translation inhibitor RaiA [Candidatus Binatia bacterium]HEU4638388.1 ribosome-associated translation inhibitor RaiA [Candidatus Binatia bacterium]